MDNPENSQRPVDARSMPAAQPWEREILERLAFASLREQKARRRWGVFFKLIAVVYLGVALIALVGLPGAGELVHDRHTALVDIQGVISAESAASAENVISSLQNAFEDEKTAAVIMRINSPGGSPVQSGIIYDEVKRLRGKYPGIPLYAVAEDLCASGGYFVAAAADKIFVNKASVVGSIGVLMDGFGFTGTMDRLGVERRLLTAGENKGFLDPFSPQAAGHREHAQGLLNEIHRQFIDVVKNGRGNRLKGGPELFSGLMWTGQKSVELGLADGFGSVESVARDIVQVEAVVDFTVKPSITDRLAKRFGTGVADAFSAFLGGSFRLH